MLAKIIKNLWNKFTQKPEYNKENDYIIIRFITSFPLTSFFIFNSIKLMFTTPSHTNIQPNLQHILCRTTFITILFNGILFEYLPNNMYSIFAQGFIFTILNGFSELNGFSDQSHNILSRVTFRTFIALSRRKYSLKTILNHDLLITLFSYIIYTHYNS